LGTGAFNLDLTSFFRTHGFEGGCTVLVLTRKLDETLVLGDHIKVKVIQIRGKQVRLGIEAPAGIVIIREEANSLKPAKGM
jgi:carbon storage regulator CsrA